MQAHRAAHSAFQQQYIDRMTDEQIQALRSANALSQQQRIQLMSPAQLQAHRVANAVSQQLVRECQSEAFRREAVNFSVADISQHDCDKLLREIMVSAKSFGGKVLILGGGFRQTLPVVPRGTRTEIIECCIKSSRLLSEFQHLSLSTNMRSEGQNEHNQWLLDVGSGNLPPIGGIYEEDTIQVPESMITADDLIDTIFGDIGKMCIEELSKRVIVAPENAQTLEMNRKIIDAMTGESMIYYSADSIDSEDPQDCLNFPVEFLNEQTPSGMPPHVLLLKKGVIIMLLRNLNPKKGMCNGTRLIVEELQRNVIKAKIISECNKGNIVLIPRIDLAPSETTLPFVLRRRQFPIIPAYAITINKSQGQSYDYVGISLQSAVFSHG